MSPADGRNGGRLMADGRRTTVTEDRVALLECRAGETFPVARAIAR
jgi:hypothetical protein